MDVSIVIVNYNTRKLLHDCLQSVFLHTKGIDFEIIVSDNGSGDGSQDMIRTLFPQVTLIENNANLGFGAANNRGLDVAQGKYILYLNSDTILLNNAVKMFFDYWENFSDKENLGALGANLVDGNGKPVYSCGTFPSYLSSFRELSVMGCTNLILSLLYILKIKLPPPTIHNHTSLSTSPVANPSHNFSRLNTWKGRLNHLVRRLYTLMKKQHVKYIGEADCIIGADLFMRNDEFARWDERYVLYWEDVDLSLRLATAGKKRLVIDGPEIIHLEGGSVGVPLSIKRKASFSRIHFELSRVKYMRKWHPCGPLLLLKLHITLIWLNPFLLDKTKAYMKELWRL